MTLKCKLLIKEGTKMTKIIRCFSSYCVTGRFYSITETSILGSFYCLEIEDDRCPGLIDHTLNDVTDIFVK